PYRVHWPGGSPGGGGPPAPAGPAPRSRTRSSPYRNWSSRLRCGWRVTGSTCTHGLPTTADGKPVAQDSAWCPGLKEDGLNDARDVSPLGRIERELGVRLPAEYWNGLAADERLVVAGPGQGEEIWLHPVPELPGINAAAELPGRLPGLVIIGTDGSRELLALDSR